MELTVEVDFNVFEAGIVTCFDVNLKSTTDLRAIGGVYVFE